jgi:hypothetical protein
MTEPSQSNHPQMIGAEVVTAYLKKLTGVDAPFSSREGMEECWKLYDTLSPIGRYEVHELLAKLHDGLMPRNPDPREFAWALAQRFDKTPWQRQEHL